MKASSKISWMLALSIGLAGCPAKEKPAVPEDVFLLADGAYKAEIFKLPKANEADSDYRVVFFRREGATYVRHGAEQNLLNFERPRLNPGPPPRVETTMNRLGVHYHFVVDAKGAEMVPTEGVGDAGSLVGHPTTR